MSLAAPLRVLYVEDDRVGALLFTQALMAEPRIELRTAEDGAEALALAAAWQPDLLVIDAHLPDTDGHALLVRLRALPGLAQARAIMYSADGEPEDRQRALRAGFEAYWTKPVAPEAALAGLVAIASGQASARSRAINDNSQP